MAKPLPQIVPLVVELNAKLRKAGASFEERRYMRGPVGDRDIYRIRRFNELMKVYDPEQVMELPKGELRLR